MITSADFAVLLPCLAVLCAVLLAGIAVFACLIARNKKNSDKVMKNDVYMRDLAMLSGESDTKAADGVENKSAESEQNGK